MEREGVQPRNRQHRHPRAQALPRCTLDLFVVALTPTLAQTSITTSSSSSSSSRASSSRYPENESASIERRWVGWALGVVRCKRAGVHASRASLTIWRRGRTRRGRPVAEHHCRAQTKLRQPPQSPSRRLNQLQGLRPQSSHLDHLQQPSGRQQLRFGLEGRPAAVRRRLSPVGSRRLHQVQGHWWLLSKPCPALERPLVYNY